MNVLPRVEPEIMRGQKGGNVFTITRKDTRMYSRFYCNAEFRAAAAADSRLAITSVFLFLPPTKPASLGTIEVNYVTCVKNRPISRC